VVEAYEEVEILSLFDALHGMLIGAYAETARWVAVRGMGLCFYVDQYFCSRLLTLVFLLLQLLWFKTSRPMLACWISIDKGQPIGRDVGASTSFLQQKDRVLIRARPTLPTSPRRGRGMVITLSPPLIPLALCQHRRLVRIAREGTERELAQQDAVETRQRLAAGEVEALRAATEIVELKKMVEERDEKLFSSAPELAALQTVRDQVKAELDQNYEKSEDLLKQCFDRAVRQAHVLYGGSSATDEFNMDFEVQQG